ncbi:hypothetical protein NPIL_293521, partial [Nephila pilipes]
MLNNHNRPTQTRALGVSTHTVNKLRCGHLKDLILRGNIEILHQNRLNILKIDKMPLLKAFVFQVFGFVLYNYLSEPFLEAKILPEKIANPVLAAVIAFLCFLFQLYTDNSDTSDETPLPRRTRSHKSSDKAEASDFASASRFSGTGMHEPTFFHMDVRETVMSGPSIDELIYKMAAVERVLEQTAQAARADNVFAMPDIISVEKEVYVTKQNAADTENDVNSTKPDIIAAEIHVEIASTGTAADENDEVEEQTEDEESEEQSKGGKDNSEEEDEQESKSDSAQEACEEEEEDEVTVIDASTKSKEKETLRKSNTDETESEEENETNVKVIKQKVKEEIKQESEKEEEEEEEQEEEDKEYTSKSDDDSKETGVSSEKEDIKTSTQIEKEINSKVKSTSDAGVPLEKDNEAAVEKPLPFANLHEVEVTTSATPKIPAKGEETTTSFNILKESSMEKVENLSTEMGEISSIQNMIDIPVLEEALATLVTEVMNESTAIISDSNANVQLTAASDGEIISPVISEELLNKKVNETALNQSESSFRHKSMISPVTQKTTEFIEETNDAIVPKSPSNIYDTFPKVIEASLDKDIIKNCIEDKLANESVMKPVNRIAEVTEGTNMTSAMTKQVSCTDEMVITNGVASDPMLSTEKIEEAISSKLKETDSNVKNSDVLNGNMLEPESLTNEGSLKILTLNLEQSSIAKCNGIVPKAVSNAEETDSIIETMSKKLVLEKTNPSVNNGCILKSSGEGENSKSVDYESVSETFAATLNSLDENSKEKIDILKSAMQAKVYEDNNIILSNTSETLQDEINNN